MLSLRRQDTCVSAIHWSARLVELVESLLSPYVRTVENERLALLTRQQGNNLGCKL